MTRKRPCGAAALALALPWALAGAACPPTPLDGERIADGEIQLGWKAQPRAIIAQRPFALLVQVCPIDARLLGVDAQMPEHGHGMNYRTSLRPEGAGRWHVDGLMWHMSGRWELSFTVESGGQVRLLRQSLTLP